MGFTGLLDDALRRALLRAVARVPGLPRPSRALDEWYGPEQRRPLLLAHRGDRAHFPENTVVAVVEAIRRGADGSELDVRLSKDGVPVVIHDDTVDRTMHASGRVRDFTAAELGAMEARRHPRWGDGPRVGVPTLDELLSAFPDGSVAVVELKGPQHEEPGLERAALDVMARHRQRLRLMASSFHAAQLFTLRSLDDTLPLGVLSEPEQILPLRVGLQALPLGAEALHLPTSMVSPELVRRAHEAGLRVHVWRVMSKEDVAFLVGAGVDAVMVDDVPGARASATGPRLPTRQRPPHPPSTPGRPPRRSPRGGPVRS